MCNIILASQVMGVNAMLDPPITQCNIVFQLYDTDI